MTNRIQQKRHFELNTRKCLNLKWAHLESNQAPTAPKDRGSQLLTF
jgi:hypothetical protein